MPAAAADTAAVGAVAADTAAIADLFETTLPLDRVADVYITERLLDVLLERNPQVLDRLNAHRGEATMRLANALMDWRDMWERR